MATTPTPRPPAAPAALMLAVLWFAATPALAAAGPRTLFEAAPELRVAGARATVLVFVTPDCPISNRYAPELRRIYERYGARGIAVWFVYPDPAADAAAVDRHRADYGLTGNGVRRDPGHTLVRLAGARVTPEAAVFDAAGRLVYHGRIDDRFVAFGVERPAPTTHELRDALEAVLAGRPVAMPVTTPVGCFLAELR